MRDTFEERARYEMLRVELNAVFREMSAFSERVRRESEQREREYAELESYIIPELTPEQLARFSKLKSNTGARATNLHNGVLSVEANGKNGTIDAKGVLNIIR